MARLNTALKALLMLLVAEVGLGVTSASAADLPPNLVTNPSLEEEVTTDDLPPGWGAFYSNPAAAYRASIADGGRTGKKQMRIDYVDGNGEGQFGAMPANRVPLDVGKRYVARGWVKVAGGKLATADVKLHYYAAGGAYLGQTRIGFASPGADDWQLVTVTDRAAEFPQAKFIGLAIACTGDAKAQYDDLELLAFDKEDLPADFDETYGITRSPQLAVLSRRVGTWVTTTKIKPCLWVPQGIESTGIETIRWSLGGQLLEARQKNPVTGVEQLSLTTYDARDQVYRAWFFGSDGNLPRSQTVGKWDKATEILTFENESKDEFESVARMKFIGNDLVHWKGIWKDKDGQILLDVEGTSKRRMPDRAPTFSVEATTELDGLWLAESVIMDGEIAPATAVKQTWLKFNGTELSFKIDGPELKGKVAVDTGKSPKWIDLTLDKSPKSELGRILGVYQLTGDRLKLCLRGKGERRDIRPADFSSAANSGCVLMVLKRQKP